MFGEDCPPISATKSLTGHSLGAAGVLLYSEVLARAGLGEIFAGLGLGALLRLDCGEPGFGDIGEQPVGIAVEIGA